MIELPPSSSRISATQILERLLYKLRLAFLIYVFSIKSCKAPSIDFKVTGDLTLHELRQLYERNLH